LKLRRLFTVPPLASAPSHVMALIVCGRSLQAVAICFILIWHFWYQDKVIDPQSHSRETLARVFPAFGRPARAIDHSPIDMTPQDSAFAEPGLPPAARMTLAAAASMSASPLASAAQTQLKKPRFGQISFVNSLPIVLPIERHHVSFDAEIFLEAPSRLNAMFEAGELELGAMSSYYFLSRPDLTLCPDISISCIGPVGSVLLFSKCEPHELLDGRIACSAQSASSVNLLKVLFAEQFGRWPQMVADSRPQLDNDDFDGALVIGDQALEIDSDWSQRYIRIDMGEWWHQRYGLPMVFGVWAARSDWVDKNHYRYAEICRALRTAKMLGLSRRWKDTLHEAHRRTGLSVSRLERYFKEELNFDFDAEHGEGLALYQRLLRKYELLAE
jgi:chorismate dehydratase